MDLPPVAQALPGQGANAFIGMPEQKRHRVERVAPTLLPYPFEIPQ